MGLAGMINAAMLIMAASTFHATGNSDIASIEEAHQTLTPLLGGASSMVFAIALLASGLSSSTVGTMAGQVIMQGFLKRSIPLWVRRGVTMIPALVVIAIGFEPTATLVISQVVLSFGIPFALIPLAIFTSKRKLMGGLVKDQTHHDSCEPGGRADSRAESVSAVQHIYRTILTGQEASSIMRHTSCGRTTDGRITKDV